MTRHEYEESRTISAKGYSFYALVMACMRQADTRNYERLRAAFPEVSRELQARYVAPGGVLPTDPPSDIGRRTCPNDTNGDGDCGKPPCPYCGSMSIHSGPAAPLVGDAPVVADGSRGMERGR